jgi:hypothetical protein
MDRLILILMIALCLYMVGYLHGRIDGQNNKN